MRIPGHVDMTHDAALVLAQSVADRNNARVAELAQAGVGLDPGIYLERRLAAFSELLLDDDQRAALELLYQEALERQLASDDVLEAERVARQSKLLAPAGAFAAAAAGHPSSPHGRTI